MEAVSVISIIALVASVALTAKSLANSIFASKKDGSIKVTRKDTGKTITLSKSGDKKDAKKLLDLVEH